MTNEGRPASGCLYLGMEITVKELIRELKAQHPDNYVDFGGLEFYRVKDAGEVTYFEFAQSVYRDEDGVLHVEEHR